MSVFVGSDRQWKSKVKYGKIMDSYRLGKFKYLVDLKPT